MYTLYISDDNSVVATEKETIMEHSNYVDAIQILVDRYYHNVIDLSTMPCYMRYVLPVSNKIKLTQLTLSDSAYNGEDVLQYVIPANTAFTSEGGSIQVTFTWLAVVADEDSNYTEYVRKTQEGTVYITPLVQFASFVPDEMLDEIDQRLLVMNTEISDLNNLVENAFRTMPNDVTINDDKDHLVLVNDEGQIGNGVEMNDLVNIIGTELIGTDPDGDTDGVVYLDDIKPLRVVDLDSIINNSIVKQ